MSETAPTHPTWPSDAYTVTHGWSVVTADGPDAGKFLQGFCTNDVVTLAEHEACEAMFTDVKAHVIAHGWVLRCDAESFRILLLSDRAPKLLEHLDRYLIRERAKLGSQSGTALIVSPHRLEDHELIRFHGDGLFGSDPCIAWGERDLVDRAASDLNGEGLRRMSPDEFEAFRIRSGVPRDGRDVDERNLPQELDRDATAISFKKGCYLGQEPVARIDALGRVNWSLRGVRGDGQAPDVTAEAAITGNAIARLTSVVAEGDGWVGLAYVRREHAAAGATLDFGSSPGTVSDVPMPPA